MAGFLSGIDDVRAVPWGARYLWDVAFPAQQGVAAPPAPFSTWFPALDIKEPLAKLTTYDFDAFMTKMSIPQASDSRQIQMTFADDENNTLATWLQNWINVTILNNGLLVSPLNQCIRLIQVIKLTRQRDQVQSRSYYVFPLGELSDDRSSASEQQTYSMSFFVVGGGLGTTTGV